MHLPKTTALHAGHDPNPRVGSGLFRNISRVGFGFGFGFGLVWFGSGRFGRFFKLSRIGSGHPFPTGPDPRSSIRPVNSPVQKGYHTSTNRNIFNELTTTKTQNFPPRPHLDVLADVLLRLRRLKANVPNHRLRVLPVNRKKSTHTI